MRRRQFHRLGRLHRLAPVPDVGAGELASMKAAGVLADEEFMAAKAKLLAA